MSPAQAISRDQAPRTRTSKRDLILKTAHDLFLVQGFEGTSIDQIAEAAGVSRQTIYNNFDSKEALFKAIAGALADHVVEPLLNEDLQTGDVESTLTDLAERALALMVLPSTLALHRLVVTEAPKFPEVARQIYQSGASRAAQALATYLTHQSARGLLAVADPAPAADAPSRIRSSRRSISSACLPAIGSIARCSAWPNPAVHRTAPGRPKRCARSCVLTACDDAPALAS